MSKSKSQHRPLMSVAIYPKTEDDRQRLQQALSDLVQQDLAISIQTESIEGQTIIAGMGELPLQLVCDHLVREYKVDADIGEFRVIYLETIRKPAEAEGMYIRRNQYAHVKLRLEPQGRGSSYQFVDETKESALPQRFIESANSGIQAAMKHGILSGCEVVDLRAVLYDGSYHAEDSNEMAFKIAASMAFKEAARKASPVLIEPLMFVEVVIPEDYMGTIIGDLNRRRGRIEAIEHRPDAQAIQAIVPMAELLGYAKHLRSVTQGRGIYSMRFARYEQAPNRDQSGDDEAGVTANTPNKPKPKSGYAVANPDVESE